MTETAEFSELDRQQVRFNFKNTYARLPANFHRSIRPGRVSSPHLIKLNVELAHQLGLDPKELASPEGVAVLAGNQVAEGSEPLAMAYAGHQFGYFVPQLGDGRANLIGEVVGRDGLSYDLHLKGAGPTPFSRRGDGRAALGPVLREYLVSEAMAALGIPTTRALAAISTGDRVLRETSLPGAILARVASSHLRVGSFQYFAAQQDVEAIRTLADYAIARHYAEAAKEPKPYATFLQRVISRQASLIAQWLLVGFVHGVMNTDNTTISGETIDYGPCAFLEAYDPAAVFSSIDQQGRYAYANQPNIALWNLTRLAETLLPLLEMEEGNRDEAVKCATAALESFGPQFQSAYLRGLRRKLGLVTQRPEDLDLAQDLLQRMASNEADFTLTFRRLTEAASDCVNDKEVRRLFASPEAYDDWAAKWRDRLSLETISNLERAEGMKRVNPLFIPRNHLVEGVIEAAVSQNNFAPFEQLLSAVTRPSQDQPGMERFSVPAKPEERVRCTFCGT